MGKADVFTGMSLTEKLIWLKKFGNGGGSTPTYEDRTATGNPVIFTTNFVQNAKALSVDFTPKQNLNGYSKPWAGGAGENLLPFIACIDQTQKGITFRSNADGSVHINGTATGEVLSSGKNVLQCDPKYLSWFDPGTYTIKVFGGRIWCQFTNEERARQTFSAFNLEDVGTSSSVITFTERTAVYFRVDVLAKDGAVNKDVKASIVAGSVAPTEWTPYENICPITGIDSIDVVANSNTHEFDLGRTVYGGTLNAKTGVLTIDRVVTTYADHTWTVNSSGVAVASGFNPAAKNMGSTTGKSDYDALCSMLPNIGVNTVANMPNVSMAQYGTTFRVKDLSCETAADYLARYGNAQICYTIATPLTYQLTPQQIALLEGENVIATDGDNLSVTYQVKV